MPLLLLVGGELCSAKMSEQGETKAETIQVLDLNENLEERGDQRSSVAKDLKFGDSKVRSKRSFGLLAALMERVMQAEAIEEEIESDDDDSVQKIVRCSVVLDRRSCTITETESRCTNYYERKCFLYTYPNLETVPDNNLPLQ